jgi:hypothetical protein
MRPILVSVSMCRPHWLVLLLLALPATSSAWEYQSMAGVYATCIDDDPVHGRIFAGTVEGFRYLDQASGVWTERDDEGWIGRQVYAVAWHETQAQRVLTGRENAFFKGYIELSEDLGATEAIVYMSPAGSVTGMARDPGDVDRYYACTWSDMTPGEVLRSLDGGESWVPLAGAIQYAMTSITTDPAGVIFVGGDARVTRSSNGGATWEGAWNGLPAGYGVYCVEADPEAAGHLLASNDLGLYATDNGGDAWTRILPLDCRAIDWGGTRTSIPGGPSFAFVAVVTWDDRVLLSCDNAVHWEDVTGDLPGEPVDLAFSRYDGLLYVATRTNGVYRTTYFDPAAVPPAGRAPVTLELECPAPFIAGSRFSFTLPAAGHAVLEVFDVTGRRIAAPLDAWLGAGRQSVAWNGAASGPGLRFARLRTICGDASVRVLVVE